MVVFGAGTWLLELDEHRTGVGLADVATLVGLGVEPANLTGLQLDGYVTVSVADDPAESGERDHHAVGMGVQVRGVTWGVVVLEDADAVVLPEDAVVVRVGDNRIQHGIRVP